MFAWGGIVIGIVIDGKDEDKTKTFLEEYVARMSEGDVRRESPPRTLPKQYTRTRGPCRLRWKRLGWRTWAVTSIHRLT
eukprot:4047573-Amphidinium_carterae.1